MFIPKFPLEAASFLQAPALPLRYRGIFSYIQLKSNLIFGQVFKLTFEF